MVLLELYIFFAFLDSSTTPVPGRHSSAKPASSTDEQTRTECFCEPDSEESDAEKNEIAKETRRKLKEERQRKKERKRIKKARIEKDCITERMNCFR